MNDPADAPRPGDIEKVLEISRAMVATEDLDSLLELIVRRSCELLDAERGTVFLYEPDTNELVSRVATGVDELRIPADRGISGETVRERRTINVPDVYADGRWNPEVDRTTGFKTRNILSIPLQDYEGGLVGVLQVLNKRAGGFGDHDIVLAETLGAQAGVALQRARLIGHYVEKQQMQRAMMIAREIQQGLMPEAPPACEEFDVAGFNEPADETGGDTYDFFPLPGGRCMLTVADATGHGVGPALLIAETRAMLRAVSLQGHGVDGVLATVNELLAADLGEGRFVTCFYGVLDHEASALTYASAGHGPMLFYTAETDEFDEVHATDLPLGIMDGLEFETPIRRAFAPGDLLVVTTDGFFEATNPAGEQFGMERMIECVRVHRELPARDMIDRLHRAVRTFTGGAPQADDLTAVIVKRN